MATVTATVADVCREAKRASRALAQIETAVKDAALQAVAAALERRTEEILAANERDMQAGREADIGDALLDRLRLDDARVAAIARAVRDIVALPDPVGEVIDGRRLPNGLDLRKVRVPLGVVAVVYEARPNVTVDAAALCLKSGNAIVLRGSSSAAYSNAVRGRVVSEAAASDGSPEGCLTPLPSADRRGVAGRRRRGVRAAGCRGQRARAGRWRGANDRGGDGGGLGDRVPGAHAGDGRGGLARAGRRARRALRQRPFGGDRHAGRCRGA